MSATNYIPVWEHNDPFQPGMLIRADSVNVKFDGVAASLRNTRDVIQTRMIALPTTMAGNPVIPEKPITDGFAYFTVAGDADFEPYVKLERRLKTRPRIMLAPKTEDFDIDYTFEDQRYYTVDSEGDVEVRVTTAANGNLPGSVVYINRYGPGEVRIVGGEGVVINSAAANLIRAQHSTAMLVYRGDGEWDLSGDLVAFD